MNNITVIGIRLIALFVLVKAISTLESFSVVFIDPQFSFREYWFYFIPTYLYSFLAIILLLGSTKIANFLTPRTSEEIPKEVDYQNLASVLFSTVGIFIIYLSIESLFNSVASIIQMEAMNPGGAASTETSILRIIFGGLIELIIGILLFVGGKKIAKWWNDFRNWT